MKFSRESVPTTTQVTASFLENPMAVSITILKKNVQTRNAEQNHAQKDTQRNVDLAQVFLKFFFLKCSAIFFRQKIVDQKLETHPVKSYITKKNC